MMLPRPSMKAKDSNGQLEELKTYLYQLIEALEFELEALEEKTRNQERGKLNG